MGWGEAEAFLINRLVCTMFLIIILQLTPQASDHREGGTDREGGHGHQPKSMCSSKPLAFFCSLHP